jgi:hypothetical protein
MYEGDPDFSDRHYAFLKLGSHRLDYDTVRGYRIHSESEFPFHWDDASYAELTALYCVYKNRLHDGLDYVGFSHYDKEHRLLSAGGGIDSRKLEAARRRVEEKGKKSKAPTNVTARIDELIAKSPSPIHISLESHPFQKIYDQRVLMDDRQPDVFVGDGVNCMDRILEDYNAFFKSSFTMADVAGDGFLNMCDCFVTPSHVFEKLMSFLTPIIESRKLDIYDTKRQHRLQGGLLERYVAVFFALEKIDKKDLSIVHQYLRKRRLKEPPKTPRWYEFLRRLGR